MLKAEIIEKIEKLSGFRPNQKELKEDLEKLLDFAKEYKKNWLVKNYLDIIKYARKIDIYSDYVYYQEA